MEKFHFGKCEIFPESLKTPLPITNSCICHWFTQFSVIVHVLKYYSSLLTNIPRRLSHLDTGSIEVTVIVNTTICIAPLLVSHF